MSKEALIIYRNEPNYWATKAENFVRKRPRNIILTGGVTNSGSHHFVTPNITKYKFPKSKSPNMKLPPILKPSNIKFAI